MSYDDEIARPYEKILGFLHGRGMIETVKLRDERYHDAPFFYRLFVQGKYIPGITDGRHVDASGYSAGRDLNTLFSKGLGEFFERYFLTLYHKRDLTYASFGSLQKSGIPPLELGQLAGFSEEQKVRYPVREWDVTSVFGWERAVRVATGKPVLVPAQLVYWNYQLANEVNEPFLFEPNTNGAGGMFTREGAILSGLYELIQRDAFLVYWLNTVPPPRIDPESVPDEGFQNIIRESKRYGFQIHCLNTTLDARIPSFIAVIIDPSGKGPYFVCGGGCSLNPVEALLRAVEEAWAIYISTRAVPSFQLPDNFIPFHSSLDRDQRIFVAANPLYKEHYEFFINGEMKPLSQHEFIHPPSFSSPKEELDFVVRRIEELGRGYEVYAHVVSHPILKKCGYYVAQVIVPHMVPLYLNEPNIPLGARRLKTVLEKTGHSLSSDVNPWPHPFP